jgi:peptide/nickel transport system ATP-binding protein
VTDVETAGLQDTPLRAGEPVLRVESLTKHYPVRDNSLRSIAARRRVVHAVDDVSFELYPGTAVALVGESGSGKSTVGRVLAHLEPPTAGHVLFKGKALNLKRRSVLRSYRAQVQLIFQDPYASLNPVHTVAYHLARPLRIHKLARSKEKLRAQQLALLEQVHLTPATQVIDKLPHELSGGQRQRVAIARALAVQPSVLIADEPVSMLDVSVRLSILNLLSELVKKNDLALLYITHDIASARYFAERLLVMYAGEVLEAGPAEEITQFPAHPYAQLLVSAAPDPDVTAHKGRRAMRAPGEAPSLIEPPSGCRFHPRCPQAMPICAEERPPRFDLDGEHWAACWLFRGETSAQRLSVSQRPTASHQDMSQ